MTDAVTEPSPCPNYEKREGCDCRHCEGICLCHRGGLIENRLNSESGDSIPPAVGYFNGGPFGKHP